MKAKEAHMAEDRSVQATEVPWDKLVNEGAGKAHGITDGSAPVSKNALTGGSIAPETLGMTGNKNGVGI